MIAVVTWAPNISFQTSRGQASAVGQETHAHLECAICSCWHFCYHNSYSKLRENKYLLDHNQYYLSFWSFVIAVQYLLKWSMPNKIIDLLLKLSVISVFVISRFDLLHLCNAIDHLCIQKEKKKIFACTTRYQVGTNHAFVMSFKWLRPAKKLFPRLYNLVTAKVYISADQSSNRTLMDQYRSLALKLLHLSQHAICHVHASWGARGLNFSKSLKSMKP